MACVNKKVLFDGSTIATTTIGNAVSLEVYQKSFVAYLKVSGRTAGTYAVKIQHSPDGVNWFDNGAFASASTNTSEIIALTLGDLLLPNVRAVATVTSGPGDAEVLVELYYDKDK